MITHWILHPAAPFVALTAGIAMCICLFATLKREIQGVGRKASEQARDLSGTLASSRTAIQEITTRLDEAEQRAGVLVAPAPPKSGLNLSKRSQVLRMYRHGEAPEKIASLMALPRNEVDLLLKVHFLMMDQFTGGPTGQHQPSTKNAAPAAAAFAQESR
jgi:hypothetical protein